MSMHLFIEIRHNILIKSHVIYDGVKKRFNMSLKMPTQNAI